jgi:replicative DNA helicase
VADGAAEGRVPPSDLDAEAAVLSAILLDPEAFDRVQELLRSEHFYADANRRIYEAVVDLNSNGRPVDIVSVAGYLRDKGRLQQIGGSPYLAQLSDATPAVAHVEAHAKVIREKWRVRQLIGTCQRFAAEAYGDYGEADTFLQNSAQAVSEVVDAGEGSDPAELLSDVLPGTLKALGERARSGTGLSGVDTGLRALNARTGGLARGKVHVIGARPGMGKSTLLLQIARNVAARGLGAIFASCEMTKDELALKLLSADARVDHHRVRSGRIERSEWPALAQAHGQLVKLPLCLRYCPGLTIPLLRATVRQQHNRLRARGVALGLVAVDYLQIMNGQRERGQSREEVVAGLMRGLLQVASEFDVPILVACQLNRSLESRSNKSKRPQLSDLRESGGIEQDAYTVTLLYRDDYYNRDSGQRGVLEANVAKTRGCPTGRAPLRISLEYSRVDDLAEDYELPDDELDSL